MKARLILIALVVAGICAGVAAGLYPVIRLGPELVAAERARIEAARPVVPEKPWDFWTVEVESLTAELRETRAALAERAIVLENRASQIAAEATELERTRRELVEMRRELNARIYRIEESEARNLRNLANTYAALEPAAAISILARMEETTVVKILALMKPDAVAAIFNEMGGAGTNPETLSRAASLSEKLRLFDRTTNDRP